MDISIIKNEKQYQTYLKFMHEIFDAKHGTLEGDELDLLALVIEKYEDEHYPM
tara:strand:- start:76 stop:234 length:159 start_codon:yes stop_codon:yes gene_type:complete